MRSQLANLTILVLPTGATIGPRIVLNGIEGVIEVYNAADDLFAFIDPDLGIGAVEGDQYARLSIDPTGPLLLLDAGDPDTETRPNILGRVLGGAGLGSRNLRITINSGQFPGRNSSRIFAYSASFDGTEDPVIVLSTSDVQLGASNGTGTAPNPAGSFPRGIDRRQELTANSAGYTVDTTTDMALSNVSVIGGRTYEIRLHSQWGLSAAGTWRLECHLNGVMIGEFGWASATAAIQDSVDGVVHWTPATTADTDDITVVANEVTGAATLTLQADATTPRTLTVKDVGVL